MMVDNSKKYKRCPYCGNSADAITMEVLTTLRLKMNGNCKVNSIADNDFFDLYVMRENNPDGNPCSCSHCEANFLAFPEEDTDDREFYFMKEKDYKEIDKGE